MADLVPDLSAWVDSKREAIKRLLVESLQPGGLGDLLSQHFSQHGEDVAARNQQTLDSVNLKGSVMDPGLPQTEPPFDPGASGPAQAIFVGAKGVGNLVKAGHVPASKATDAFQQAMEMFNKGAPDQEVWNATAQTLAGTPLAGIARQPSRNVAGTPVARLISEIPDDQATFKHVWSTPDREALLSDAMDHPLLYSAYPDVGKVMANVPAKYPAAQEGFGSFDPMEGSIQAFAKDPSAVLLHEAQHAVQFSEGLPHGSNPKSELERLYAQYAASAKGQGASQLPGTEWMKAFPDAKAQAYDNYKNNIGEVLARMVEQRRKFQAIRGMISPMSHSESMGYPLTGAGY